MATLINQTTVLNSLHNLMGHRVNPGGTDDDLKRYIQASFEYCWRYYKWGFSLKTATIDDDGLLPEDFDYDGWRRFDGVTEAAIEDTIASGNTSSAVIWDTDEARYILDPAAAGTIVYQIAPPVLDDETSVPFPSSQIVALGATVYAKQAENPTRADIQQEWDLFHAELDQLVGKAEAGIYRRPKNHHDVTGGYTGYVG